MSSNQFTVKLIDLFVLLFSVYDLFNLATFKIVPSIVCLDKRRPSNSSSAASATFYLSVSLRQSLSYFKFLEATAHAP